MALLLDHILTFGQVLTADNAATTYHMPTLLSLYTFHFQCCSLIILLKLRFKYIVYSRLECVIKMEIPMIRYGCFGPAL